jgi:hypothetical protein
MHTLLGDSIALTSPMLPTSDDQIRFLVQIQRLLDEGQFVATYKFALLQSLADIAIEQGDDSEASLAVSTDAIAEKFIRYYWAAGDALSGSGGHASASAEHGTTGRRPKYCPPGAGRSGRFAGCRHTQRSRLEQACPRGCRGGPNYAAVETPDGRA